jgi:alkylhydroperoxidase family enzyme
MRILGTPEARIRRLEQDLLTADEAPRERGIFDFARRLSRANPLPGEAALARLRQGGLSDGEIREVALVAAITAAANRVTTFPALPPEKIEALPDRVLFRLMRRLMSPKLGRHVRPGVPSSLAPQAGEAPFGYLARGLDGLPLARRLLDLLGEAWASPLLPQRAKGLVFAVVAHGLGDPASQREAARLLAEEGFDKADLEGVLAHLASPKLERVESLVVPFARETIWYRPAQIQRRARALRAELGAPAFLELVGISAFANLVSRVGLLVGD